MHCSVYLVDDVVDSDAGTDSMHRLTSGHMTVGDVGSWCTHTTAT
jgi:hypothetical protein